MSFFDFLESLFAVFGSAGDFLILVLVFLVGLGIYKFVKDWLPW